MGADLLIVLNSPLEPQLCLRDSLSSFESGLSLPDLVSSSRALAELARAEEVRERSCGGEEGKEKQVNESAKCRFAILAVRDSRRGGGEMRGGEGRGGETDRERRRRLLRGSIWMEKEVSQAPEGWMSGRKELTGCRRPSARTAREAGRSGWARWRTSA